MNQLKLIIFILQGKWLMKYRTTFFYLLLTNLFLQINRKENGLLKKFSRIIIEILKLSLEMKLEKIKRIEKIVLESEDSKEEIETNNQTEVITNHRNPQLR